MTQRLSAGGKICLLLLLVVTVFAFTGCPGSGDAIDVTVASVQVTQAIQTPTNTVQLIAQRRTAVRATLAVSGGASPAGVTGRLHVFVNGAEITPVAGIAPLASITVPAAPNLANENDTLNFELPTPSGIAASTDVDFRVDVTAVPGESDTTNNSGSANDLTFVNRTNPIIFFTRINYTPSGLGNPPDAFIQPGTGDAMVRGIYPVNEADPTLYRQGLFPSLTFSEDANGDGLLDVFAAEGDNLISLLASCRQLIVDSGVGPADQVFLYGWIAGPVDGNGLSTTPGRNGFGNSEPNRGQRTFAHEFGHLLGNEHPVPDLNLSQVGWDVGARLPGNPAGNNVTGRVKPTTLFDIMVPALVTNQAWIDTTRYTSVLSNAVFGGADSGDAAKPSARVAVIQGIFDPTGERLVTFKPVFRYPWVSQAFSRPRGLAARYVAEVRDDAGTVTSVRFDALKTEDAKEGRVARGFFEVMIPVDPNREIASVRITDLQGGKTYGAQRRSAPPRVRIASPQTGAALGERTEVSWEGSDPDTPANQLWYQVAYSPDAGRTWVPVAVDVRGKSATFDSTEIQIANGTGAIRVFVGDGVSTAFAEVGKLTTRAAKYKGYETGKP